MSVFIEWPWFALVPASAMRRRWLCTGECNIRVDLLLLYPVLLLISVTAGFVAVRVIVRRRAAL